jgi:hypothetical protein
MPAACVGSINGALARFDNRARDWHYESCQGVGADDNGSRERHVANGFGPAPLRTDATPMPARVRRDGEPG